MKIKELGIWIAVLVVLIGGLSALVAAVNNSPSPSIPTQMTNLPAVSNQDFVKGASDSAKAKSDLAKVTLIEYGDFQCPACAAYFPAVKQLSEEFGKDLRIVHRFFPLTNIHKNAMIAAQAAYAAGLQNKFWEMHDKLYENQNRWSNSSPKDTFIGYAKDLGLDLDKFKIDLDSDSTKQFINNERNKAASIGINSTPTFFVNSYRIQNPAGYDAFKKIIQDEISKK